MLQFKVYNDKSFNSDMLCDLINAIRITSKKYNIDINKYSFDALLMILRKRSYISITRDKGMRKLVGAYAPDAFFDLIIDMLEKTNLYRKEDIVTIVDGKYHISEENLDYLIKEFLKNISTSLKGNIDINFSQSHSYIPNPENVKMYSPSDELREAIKNNTQTSVKSSSVMFNDMSGYSHVGKYRSNQEDSYYIGYNPINPNFKILVVADGMGGSKQGEVASNIAVKELMKWFDSLPADEYYETNNQRLSYLLQLKINDIQKKILQSVYDGGTTLCVSLIKNNSIIMGNIGDSQGYIIKDNELIYATDPDSVPVKYGVPRDIARFHKRNNQITSFLGKFGEEEVSPKINITQTNISANGIYKVILCSDGVTDCIDERKIIDIANESGNPAQALVEYALENNSYLSYDFKLLSGVDKMIAGDIYNNGQLNEKINGGKDNTTAVSAVVRR